MTSEKHQRGDYTISTEPESIDLEAVHDRTTFDAHALYAKVEFAPLAHPEYFMEIDRPTIYIEPKS